MERADVEGITLKYEITGSGEPVVLIHGALIADTFRPLLAEPALNDRYRLITYHRRGHAGSGRTSGPVSIARQAADCRVLLRHLGVERAHVVGHSYGGSIALQLALDFPEVVHSLALLETALFGAATGQAYREALVRGEARYREAGAAVVIDEFLEARWPGYRASLERAVPGALAQAVADAETWWEREAPALRSWSCVEEDLRQITQPALAVLGGDSEALLPRFGETHRTLLTFLSDVEGFVLPGTTHFMLVEDPRGMAEALADFYARHPLPTRPLETPDQR